MTDRRIIRTKMILEEALLTLLEEKNPAEISILNITDQAFINRSTFYAHYQDKDFFISSFITSNLALLEKALRPEVHKLITIKNRTEAPDPLIERLFQSVMENEKFYKVMFKHSIPEFNDQLFHIVRESLYQRMIQLKMEQKLLVQMDILLDYATIAIIGTVRHWFRSNLIYSASHMALQLSRIAELGINQAMGLHSSSQA